MYWDEQFLYYRLYFLSGSGNFFTADFNFSLDRKCRGSESVLHRESISRKLISHPSLNQSFLDYRLQFLCRGSESVLRRESTSRILISHPYLNQLLSLLQTSISVSGKRICTTSRIYVENIDQPSLSKSNTFFTTDFNFCVGETNLYYIDNLLREYWSAIPP